MKSLAIVRLFLLVFVLLFYVFKRYQNQYHEKIPFYFNIFYRLRRSIQTRRQLHEKNILWIFYWLYF